MIELDIAHAEMIGARAEQQDLVGSQLLGAPEGGALVVLADGLGGHESGAEASRIAVEIFTQAAARGDFADPDYRRDALNATLHAVNDRIAAATDPNHGQRSMASTAVAAVIAEGTLRWVSVGDSHLYIFRRGQLAKLNEDHSQAGLMVKSGQYLPNDEAVLNARSVLVSALTGRPLELVDNPARAFALETGDVVLLASDGLNTLSETEIAHIVDVEEEKGADAVCEALLRNVTERRLPRQDNTTVVVARVLNSHATRHAPVDASSDVPTTNVTAPTQAATAPISDVAEAASSLAVAEEPAPAAGAEPARAGDDPAPVAGQVDVSEAASDPAPEPPASVARRTTHVLVRIGLALIVALLALATLYTMHVL